MKSESSLLFAFSSPGARIRGRYFPTAVVQPNDIRSSIRLEIGMVPAPNSSGGSAAREEASLKVPAKDPDKKDEKKDEDLVSSFFALVLF